MNALNCSRVVVIAALLPQIGRPTAPTPPTAMKTFVIVFRQGPHPLTGTDKQRRAAETSVWARQQNGAGHKLDPRILAPESAHRGPEKPAADAAGTERWPITALLFLEARDLSEAADVAASHPALRYGADVEVRPWAPPIPVAPTPATP